MSRDSTKNQLREMDSGLGFDNKWQRTFVYVSSQNVSGKFRQKNRKKLININFKNKI